MALKKLSKSVLKMLSERHKDEYTAHYFYQYLGQCFKNAGLLIAAEFYYKEAQDELTHAKMLEEYAAIWNSELEFLPIDSPVESKGLVESLDDAYALELGLLNKYKTTAMECFENSELEHFTFLQKIIEIQTQSVGEFSDKLNMIALFDKTDASWLFNFEKKIFK